MEKKYFLWVLECALLSFDNVSYKEMLEKGTSPATAATGIKLCEYLKLIKLNKGENAKTNKV